MDHRKSHLDRPSGGCNLIGVARGGAGVAVAKHGADRRRKLGQVPSVRLAGHRHQALVQRQPGHFIEQNQGQLARRICSLRWYDRERHFCGGERGRARHRQRGRDRRKESQIRQDRTAGCDGSQDERGQERQFLHRGLPSFWMSWTHKSTFGIRWTGIFSRSGRPPIAASTVRRPSIRVAWLMDCHGSTCLPC